VIGIWAAAVCSLLIRAAPAGDVDAARRLLDPSSDRAARLLKVQPRYALWLSSQLHAGAALDRAPRFTHRFYRQRLDEPKAEWIYELVDTSVRYTAAIRDDGSLLLESGRQFHFVPATGPAVKQDLGWLECLAVYPDGLLAEDWSARDRRQFQPVYFVPFDGERLRLDDRLLVVEAGVKSFAGEEGLGYPGEPYRQADVLVWVVDSTLHAFDLKSRQRKALKLGRDLHASYRVTAFDGATVVCGVYAFDAASGELLGEPEYAKRPRNVASVFAVRSAIGYYYESGALRATDLAARDGASIRVRDALPVVPLQSDDGLTVWDGRRWTLVPWLKTVRRPVVAASVEGAYTFRDGGTPGSARRCRP
jgi:hypothetical protein